MKSLNSINEEYIERIQLDIAGHAESAAKEIAYMADSTAKYHGRCVSTLYIPKIFRKQEIACFEQLLDTLYGIFHKVTDHYLNDEAYRKLFGFEPRLEELILKKPLYECQLPMARIDIFYDEETQNFKFCEFNTDGSSAMNEDRELNHALKLTKGYQELSREYNITTFELFDSWVEESLAIYRQIDGAKESPYVVIADFMEHATNNEFEIFASHYRARGIDCEVCEIRDLKYQNGRLLSTEGKEIDLIYRRAVTSDIMKHYDEVADFIQAVKEDAVCLLGDFRTQVVHNKVLYKILYLPETQEFLTEEEINYIREHVPYTASMINAGIPEQEIAENKDRWILKPEDSYGSLGVYAGVEFEDLKKWKELVDKHKIEGYLLQAFQEPYVTKNIDFSKGSDTDFIPVHNLTGLFVYGGRFRGIYSRVSRGKIISTQYSEIALPTIMVEDNNA